MKTIYLLLISMMLLNATSAFAQDDFGAASSSERERLVVELDHMQVAEIEKILRAVTANKDVRVLSEANSNKLIVDAPTDETPAVLGLIRELDRPKPLVTVHVTEVAMTLDTDLPLSSGKTADVISAMERGEKEGVLKVIDSFELAALNNTPGRISTGRQEFRKSNQLQADKGAKHNSGPKVGTQLEVTPRAGEHSVTLSLAYVRAEEIGSTDPGDSDSSTISQVSLETFLRIPNDESIVIAGTRIGPDDKPVRWKLIVSAEAKSVL